jgi:HAD superfamily hydrolase (TIGR01509 family)
MKPAQAVIFDMDGVIVDSEPRHERAFMDVVSEIGFGDRLRLDFADYVGRSDQELWVDFVKHHQPPHSLESLLAMKRERVLKILRKDRPLFDGLPELIEGLSAKYLLAVASGSERIVVEAVLELGELARFFPVVVTAADVRAGKPAPDIFLRAAKLLGIESEACWVIEDSKPGIAAGLAAQMRVIAITNTHSAEELSNATHVVRTYAEIERLLLSA